MVEAVKERVEMEQVGQYSPFHLKEYEGERNYLRS